MERAERAQLIEQLAGALHEAERLQRRVDGISERLHAYSRERTVLQQVLAKERRALLRVRMGPLGLWLGLLGKRAERLREARATLDRLERRHRARDELIAALERDLVEATSRVAGHPAAASLRTRFEAEVRAQRADLERAAPDLALRLSSLEERLPRARANLAAAERALGNVQEIARRLESARKDLERAINRSVVESLLLDHILVTFSKYSLLNAATADLKAAQRLMAEVEVLDSVRDDLEPLEPMIGSALQAADYFLDSLLADITVMVRMENSLDGVVEAEKLFADLTPNLTRAVVTARAYAQNIERRWRAALVEAAQEGVSAASEGGV